MPVTEFSDNPISYLKLCLSHTAILCVLVHKENSFLCYICRLDERKRRKEFILERNLLFPNPLEKDLTNEDKEVYHRYKVFMRFLSKEEHEALVRSVLEERKIRRRIQELQVFIYFIKFRYLICTVLYAVISFSFISYKVIHYCKNYSITC